MEDERQPREVEFPIERGLEEMLVMKDSGTGLEGTGEMAEEKTECVIDAEGVL